MVKAEKERKRVCVTGAGGFVASWLVQRLLSSGDYVVHGTVRDPSDPKNAHLKEMDGAGERLRLFKADMMDYASVAAAVAGCCGVFHVASPVPSTKPLNPDAEVLVPAVTGTRNVLTACHEANVRRVVVVSSVAAVIVSPGVPNNDDAVLDEDAWSDEDYCRATENWYYLSKTLAEREALAYAADKAGRLDVVTVCPPLVLGPLLQPTMNFSSSIVVKVLKGNNPPILISSDRSSCNESQQTINCFDLLDRSCSLVLQEAMESPCRTRRQTWWTCVMSPTPSSSRSRTQRRQAATSAARIKSRCPRLLTSSTASTHMSTTQSLLQERS
ncbi:hypothetical protein GUJ93_ZPchr0006g40929 [Zizania palustris]|uniref:NAD-dependent epimerase/dehydratase domain-containing protein n=1 Tax=Zizania palustris TaxID=103762 RepID=A0A8J5SZV7_ZIZPA|nr:hypothetical protein GUJ93_ZPchr0006g40929 [Zizania palustris]